MAARSFLYATDRQPWGALDRGRFYSGIGEWAGHVPALALLAVSDAPRVGVSVLSNTPDGAPAPNIYGGPRGVARTLVFLRALRAIVPGKAEGQAIDRALAHLPGPDGDVLVLEPLELFEAQATNSEAWETQAAAWCDTARALGAAMDALPQSPALAARNLALQLDGKGTGPLARLTLGPGFDDPARGTDALGLGGFARTPFLEPLPREPFLIRAELPLLDQVQSQMARLLPPKTRDWALVVERVFEGVRADGSFDRRHSFVLVTEAPGPLGLGRTRRARAGIDLGPVRETLTRLLEWRIERMPGLRAVVLDADGLRDLPGKGLAARVLDGSVPLDKLLAGLWP